MGGQTISTQPAHDPLECKKMFLLIKLILPMRLLRQTQASLLTDVVLLLAWLYAAMRPLRRFLVLALNSAFAMSQHHPRETDSVP